MATATKPKLKIRKGDLVEVLTGKDVGRRAATCSRCIPRKGRVLVENVNIGPSGTRGPRPVGARHPGRAQMTPGGVIDIPAFRARGRHRDGLCPTATRATRVGYRYRDSKDGREGARLSAR